MHNRERLIVYYYQTLVQLIQNSFAKNSPTYKEQVVNPRHQTPQTNKIILKAWNILAN